MYEGSDNDLLFELEEDTEGKKKQKSVDRNYVVGVIIQGIITEICIVCFLYYLVPYINTFLFSLMKSGNRELDGTIMFNLAFWELLVCILSAIYVVVHCIYSIYKQLTGYSG